MDGLDSYTRVIVNQASMSTCPTSHRLRILGGEGGGGGAGEAVGGGGGGAGAGRGRAGGGGGGGEGGGGGGGLPARIPNIQSLTPLVATFAQQSTQR